MKTKHIKIIEDEKLAELTHAASYQMAQHLRGYIRAFERQGIYVSAAFVRGRFVPNCYRFTARMTAPGFAYDYAKRTLTRVPFRLEARPRARGARFGLTLVVHAGTKAPSGWKCIKRTYQGDGLENLRVRA